MGHGPAVSTRGKRAAVEVVVDIQAYNELEFVLSRAETPRVPSHAEETLRDAVMIDYYDFLMTKLPNTGRKASGPDGIPYELRNRAPDSLLRAFVDCINAILEGKTAPPESWLGWLVQCAFSSSTRESSRTSATTDQCAFRIQHVRY